MKILLLFVIIVLCLNYASSQTITVMNASHSYDITDLKFAPYSMYGDILEPYNLRLNLPIPSRAGLKVNSLPSGYYYILYKLSNNLSYEVRKFKFNKSETIWLGRGIESRDYYEQ